MRILFEMVTGICKRCGGMTIRTGTCMTCTQCGESDGCG
jgi:hypothetical protein